MLLSKQLLLLYHLSLYPVQTTALPQLFVFHVDRPKSSSISSLSVIPSSTGNLSKAAISLGSALQTTTTSHISSSPSSTSPSSIPRSAITSSLDQSSVWVDLPPVSGFSWPGVILSAKISTVTLDLPPISGFSWPGVSFETTVEAPAPKKTTTTTMTKAETSHLSGGIEASRTSQGKPRAKTGQTQPSHPTSHTSSKKPSTTSNLSSVSSITKHVTTITFEGHFSTIINPPPGISTMSFSTLLTIAMPTLSIGTGLANQGITQISSFSNAAAAATANPTPVMQPDLTTGSEIALGVTIAGGLLLLCLLVLFLYFQRRRRNGNPFRDEMAYNPAGWNDDDSQDVRPVWYRSPTAPPPSANPSPPTHSPPNLDDLNDLMDPTDSFAETSEPRRHRWTNISKKVPWNLGRSKKEPVYPEVAYLYDTPSTGSQYNETTRQPARETFYEPAESNSNRPSYESLSTAPDGRQSYESYEDISAPTTYPNVTPNYSPLNTSPPRNLLHESGLVSPITSRTQYRNRASSVEMSPRVRYLHEGSDEAVMELLPEGMENWTPGEDTAVRGPILESPIPEHPEMPSPPVRPSKDGNGLARHGSVSRDFAGDSTEVPIGMATSSTRTLPSWQRARGVEGLGIDTDLHVVRTGKEAPGWSQGRWKGPPRKEGS